MPDDFPIPTETPPQSSEKPDTSKDYGVTYHAVWRSPRNGFYLVRSDTDKSDMRYIPAADFTGKKLASKDWNKLSKTIR